MNRCQAQLGTWFVYILFSSSTGCLYTGITTDPERRLEEHNGKGKRGARYTRKGRPWVLVHIEKVVDRPGALRRELTIKKMNRKRKLRLIGWNTKL